MNYNSVYAPAALSMRSPLRVLVASHSHPKLTNGGAEIAAFRLFTELAARDGVETWFLG
jgi:hypothetical protein